MRAHITYWTVNSFSFQLRGTFSIAANYSACKLRSANTSRRQFYSPSCLGCFFTLTIKDGCKNFALVRLHDPKIFFPLFACGYEFVSNNFHGHNRASRKLTLWAGMMYNGGVYDAAALIWIKSRWPGSVLIGALRATTRNCTFSISFCRKF